MSLPVAANQLNLILRGILYLPPQAITFSFITWHFMRSKASASSAIFLYICFCLQAIRIEHIFYYHAVTCRTRTVVLQSGQRSDTQSVHTLDVRPTRVGHTGLFFVQRGSFCLLSKQDVRVSGQSSSPRMVLLQVPCKHVLCCQHRSLAHQLIATLANCSKSKGQQLWNQAGLRREKKKS